MIAVPGLTSLRSGAEACARACLAAMGARPSRAPLAASLPSRARRSSLVPVMATPSVMCCEGCSGFPLRLYGEGAAGFDAEPGEELVAQRFEFGPATMTRARCRDAPVERDPAGIEQHDPVGEHDRLLDIM